ncbi:phosphatase PAP2 family protein [Lachnospira multipara]|uniref:phosphatase PAP2 family protein n=1 Tax=Lachnospira multipara TaxID=28051 RepID=UPI0009DCF325|nr:phosphatase PAP2 family protein [Lachnospira multipara]
MKDKLKRFFRENWRLLYGLYVFIYFPWFFTLEKKITLQTPGVHILNTSIDEAIPLIEWFIVPYILWAFYVVITVVYFYFKADDKEYRQLAMSLIFGMSIALTICMIYPNGLTLRPEHVSDSVFGRMITKLYISDTSTNVFPSIHVLNSLIVTFAIIKSKLFREKKFIIVKVCASILCVLICLSTLFLKQHCISDVLGAMLLFWVQTNLIYAVDYRKLYDRVRAKAMEGKLKELIQNRRAD